MFRIKRTKHATPNPLDAFTGAPAPAVHWAAAVAPEGNITAWVSTAPVAGAFDEATCARVRGHYAARANAGRLEFEDVAPPLPAPEPIRVEPSVVPAATETPASVPITASEVRLTVPAFVSVESVESDSELADVSEQPEPPTESEEPPAPPSRGRGRRNY